MALSAVIPLIAHNLITNHEVSRFFTVCSLSVICSTSIIYKWGLGYNAKQMVKQKFKAFFKRNNIK
ncbi:hypothetical protein M067_5044 [Bacteroides fragilis str. J-143-4]|nr:hypothetical protein M067_5044 [Bacteroides fragilis str. J-143-4]